MSRVIGYQRPAPPLQRVDVSVTATGTCSDCGRSFPGFEDATKHAVGEQHTVRVAAVHTFDVVPRGQAGDLL